MPEHQNVEYKQIWHDEYLKWICGFANANGGTIFIGKDNNGKIVGVDNAKRLLEEIPNKVRDVLGIMVDVNLNETKQGDYLEIVVEPYPNAISYKGQYHYRSGSTKQELKGNSLNEFLLKKSGKTWDDVIEPRATFDDIDENTFFAFLRMSNEKGRMPETDGLTIEQAFDKLLLTENGQLKRAAIILFGKNPTRFYPNTFVKVGYFKGNDIMFHDVVEGNLITLLREVSNLLNFKYFTKKIHFEGLYRIETGEYPAPAIREMLLNALIHRNYMGAMTQFRMYDDCINIWNDGSLPSGISSDSLKRPHRSIPRNPLIADVCFKGGLIDSWGSGTIRIIETCKQANLPEPELIEEFGGFSVTLFKNNLTTEQLSKLGLNDRQLKAVEYVKEKGKVTNADLQELFGVSKATATRDLTEMVEKYKIFEKIGQTGVGTNYVLKMGS